MCVLVYAYKRIMVLPGDFPAWAPHSSFEGSGEVLACRFHMRSVAFGPTPARVRGAPKAPAQRSHYNAMYGIPPRGPKTYICVGVGTGNRRCSVSRRPIHSPNPAAFVSIYVAVAASPWLAKAFVGFLVDFSVCVLVGGDPLVNIVRLTHRYSMAQSIILGFLIFCFGLS